MAINTFIIGIIENQARVSDKTEFVSNTGVKLDGNPKDLLVADSCKLKNVSRFISRGCTDRLEFYNQEGKDLDADDQKLYEEVHRIFRSPVGMTPIADKNGCIRCYKDKNKQLHDMVYIKQTFEELPIGAFKMKQRVFTFIGKSNSTKTTMIEELSIFMLGLFTENPALQVEIANRPGSPVFNVYADICTRFDENRIPERSHVGIEIQETSYIVKCRDPEMNSTVQMILQFKDIPGEDFEDLSYDSYIMKENRIPIIVISCNDLIEHHASNSGFTKLDKYLLDYAQKAEDKCLADEYEREQPIFILSNFDIAAQHIDDERIKKVWERGSSIVRTDTLHLERHREGLRLREIQNVSHELLVPFLRTYSPSIFNHMQKIAGGEPLVFACAAVGREPVKKEDGSFEYPEGFVPFNLDEPILYLMNREGLYPAHKDEVREGTKMTGLFQQIVDTFLEAEYENATLNDNA